MLIDLKLYFDENICCSPTNSNDENTSCFTAGFEETIIFNYDTFQRILSDLHSNPCKVMELGNKDIKNIMELTNNQIKLKKSIAIIYYYDQIRLIGFNKLSNKFEFFNLPLRFDNIFRKLSCFYGSEDPQTSSKSYLNESKIDTLLNSQFEEADFYFSENGFTFDANDHIMYYIYPAN